MAEALNSVLSQSGGSFEVIVVNDGSDEQHMPAYMALCDVENITLLNLGQSINGHGPSFALNMGVNIAKGQYIAFLDDDDQWTSMMHLSNAKKRLLNLSAGVYLTLQEAYKNGVLENNRIWLSSLDKFVNKDRATPIINVETLIKCNGFAHRNNLIISKPLYEMINGHDESLRYEEDREFYLRAIERAENILFFSEFISCHNIPIPKENNNLSTSTSEMKKMQSRLYLLNSVISQSRNIDIINYVEMQKNYTLKHIAEFFYRNKRYGLASHYSRQAVCLKFSLKWIVFTFYLSIRNLVNA